jgi:hypothetical protein
MLFISVSAGVDITYSVELTGIEAPIGDAAEPWITEIEAGNNGSTIYSCPLATAIRVNVLSRTGGSVDVRLVQL